MQSASSSTVACPSEGGSCSTVGSVITRGGGTWSCDSPPPPPAHVMWSGLADCHVLSGDYDSQLVTCSIRNQLSDGSQKFTTSTGQLDPPPKSWVDYWNNYCYGVGFIVAVAVAGLIAGLIFETIRRAWVSKPKIEALEEEFEVVCDEGDEAFAENDKELQKIHDRLDAVPGKKKN